MDRQPDEETHWRLHGVRIVRGDELDLNTPQTAGMTRAAAITHARTGASKIWAGTVTIQPNAKTGAHHHGALESVIYVVRGRARMRWGDRLEFVAEAGPGDFIYVPPYVPHQEINAATDAPLECVVVRSDQEAVVVNLDIPVVESPETVYWVDAIHRPPDREGQ
jgi:uncharacterized RmlC-like cupin family protein